MKRVNGECLDIDILNYALELMKEEKEKWYSFIPKKILFHGYFTINFESLIVIDLCFRSIIKRHEDKLVMLDISLVEGINKMNDRLSRKDYNDTLFTKKEVNSIIDLIDGIIYVLKICINKYNE